MILSKEEFKNLGQLWFNPLSIIGFCLVVISVTMIVALVILQFFWTWRSPYAGLITFIILPPFVFLGLLLIPFGIFRQNRILHKTGARPNRFFTIDFNLSKHRRVFVLFLVCTAFVVIIVSSLSVKAFLYSESIEFCSTCHSVMSPESTTHQLSPHARVACVECHVGEGAGWYVKSKLSGLYQVYSVIFKKYSKPIETPIHNLRPARDTCEHCHWPQFFTEDKIYTSHFYMQDEDNTPGSISLLMKVGGSRSHIKPTGIHWHIANKVDYISTDEANQEIPWIRVTRDDGTQVVFQSGDEPLSEEEIQSKEIHTMDCIDCHNRPSHVFKPPGKIMNNLLYAGKVNPDIPDIRRIGSEALREDYTSSEDADKRLPEYIRGEYADNDEVMDEYGTDLESAIKVILESYHQSFFPGMKTRWDVHYSNIGHMVGPGCFRCHNGDHESEDGEVISRDCNLCHTIAAQEVGGSGDDLVFNPKGIDFVHPEDIDEEWMDTMCFDCHTGE